MIKQYDSQDEMDDDFDRCMERMQTENLLAIAEFLGDEMTNEQALRLMGEARKLSIADHEYLLNTLPGGPLYTEISMHDGEMGGLCRY